MASDEYDLLLDSISPSQPKAAQARPSVDYRKLYQTVGQKYGVDPDLLYNQAKHESVNFNPTYVFGPGRSPKGAAGLAQFMPNTARQYGLRVQKGTDDRFNPEKSADAHARLMKDLIAKYGDTQLALAAYNSGTNKTPEQARRAMQRIPETKGYVQKIAPQGDAYDQLLNEQSGQPARQTKQVPRDDYDNLLDSISGQTPPPRQSLNRVARSAAATRTPTGSRQPSVPMKYSGTGRAFDRFHQLEVGAKVGGEPARPGPAMSARTPSTWERIKEAVEPYVPGLSTLDTPFGVKTDPLRGAVSGVTLGALGDPRQVSREEQIVDPEAQAKADLAHQAGSLAPAVIPYLAAEKALSVIPLLAQEGRVANIARTALTFGGVELGREAIRAKKTDTPLDPKEVAISTAIGGAMGGLSGVNPSLKRRLIAFVTPGVVADAARGTDPTTAVFNALTNLGFGLYAGGARAPRDLETRLKNAETKAQPNVAAQPEAVEPARIDTTPSAEVVARAQGTRPPDQGVLEPTAPMGEPSALRPEPEQPQKFFHRDFGEITESPNQKQVGKNRVRVVAQDGTEHVIRRANMTGAGNIRAVPIPAEKPAEPVQPEPAIEPSVEAARPPEATAFTPEPIKTVQPTEKNPAVHEGKPFWIGTVNKLDGQIENTYTKEQSEASGNKHQLYMSPSDIEGINNGERGIFWIGRNGQLQTEWREGLPEPIRQRILDQLDVGPKGETKAEVPKPVVSPQPLEKLRRSKRAGEAGFSLLATGEPRKVGSVLAEAQRAVQLEPPPASRRIIAGIKRLPTTLQTALTSEFTPLRKLEEAVRSDKPVVDMARKFEQVAGAPAKAEADFIDFKKAVVEPIRQHVDDFNSYLFLKRVEDRITQDPERKRVAGWTVEKAQQGLKELEDSVGSDAMRQFEQAGKVYQGEMKKALQLQVDSGRMSQELYDKIVASNDFYAPFKVLKYIEEGESPTGAGRRIATTQQLTKKIVGIDSEDFQIGNILQTSAEQLMRSRVLAEKNLKMRDLAKLADTPNDLIRKVETDAHPRPGYEIVRYFEDGKPQGLEVSRDVAKSIQGMNAAQASAVAKVAMIARRGLQWGATSANAGFQMVNLFFADLPRQALVSKYGLRSPKDIYQFPMDWAYSLATAIKGNFGKPNELFMDWLRSGAANSTIQRELTPELFRPKPISPGRTHPAKRVLGSIAEFSNAIEETTKILGLKRGMRIENFKNLSPEAQRGAMEKIAAEVRNYSGSPDFLRKGSETRNLNLLFMFFNARLQGVAGDFRRLSGKAGTKDAAIAWARIGAAVGVPATVLALVNRLPENKDDYDRIPDWEKQNYFMIPRNSYFTNEDGQRVRDYWRVPKRDITGLVGNAIEGFVNFAYERDRKSLGKMSTSMLEGLSPINIEGNTLLERGESIAGSLNPAFKVPAEVVSNRDFFRKRAIVPDYMKKASPSEQYRKSTPQAYVKAGQALNVSPLRIEHAVEGFTGGGFGQFSIRKPQEGRSPFSQYPVVRRFVRSGAVKEERGVSSTEEQLANKQLQRKRVRDDLVEKLRQGKQVDLNAAIQRGDITESDRKEILKDSKMNARQSRFSDLPPAMALERYERMKPSEREEFRDIMTRKAHSLSTSTALTDEQKVEFKKRIESLGITLDTEGKAKSSGFKSAFSSRRSGFKSAFAR